MGLKFKGEKFPAGEVVYMGETQREGTVLENTRDAETSKPDAWGTSTYLLQKGQTRILGKVLSVDPCKHLENPRTYLYTKMQRTEW